MSFFEQPEFAQMYCAITIQPGNCSEILLSELSTYSLPSLYRRLRLSSAILPLSLKRFGGIIAPATAFVQRRQFGIMAVAPSTAQLQNHREIRSESIGSTQQNGTSKKLHGRAFYESIGSPKLILAPMVEQSEFVCLLQYCIFLSGAVTESRSLLGVETAFPLLPTSFTTTQSPSVYAHVSFQDVWRKVKLPRLALPAPKVCSTISRRQVLYYTTTRLRETSGWQSCL